MDLSSGKEEQRDERSLIRDRQWFVCVEVGTSYSFSVCWKGSEKYHMTG